jgi:hypothetical protein
MLFFMFYFNLRGSVGLSLGLAQRSVSVWHESVCCRGKPKANGLFE